MKKSSYNTDTFPFTSIVEKIFQVNNLALIHEKYQPQNDIPTDPSQDQKTNFHKIFYATYNVDEYGFLETYRSFINHIAKEHFAGSDIIYQTKPTFRVHSPNNIAVAKWHKDKAYNHSEHEVNIFLPFTDAFGTNTIWAESEEDKEDYAPMEAKVGEYYVWNGANLNHGNKQNDTGFSRVSIDFRIIESKYFNYNGHSVTVKMPMELGHYWTKLC